MFGGGELLPEVGFCKEGGDAIACFELDVCGKTFDEDAGLVYSALEGRGCGEDGGGGCEEDDGPGRAEDGGEVHHQWHKRGKVAVL